jgi:hypothetical protein
VTRPLFEPTTQRQIRKLGFGNDQLFRRPPPKRRQGYYEIKVFADRNALDGNLDDTAIVVTAGDGKFLFPIPISLDNCTLTEAEGGISATGSSDVEVMIGYCSTDPTTFPGSDMLTAPITIAAGDFVSFVAGTPTRVTPIDTANDLVLCGDWLSVNVTGDGGGTAEGLVVMLQFDALRV